MEYKNFTITTKEIQGKWIFEIPELNLMQDSKPMTGGIMNSEIEALNVANAYIDYKIKTDEINNRISLEIMQIENNYKESIL